ncbi:MAG: hypothetical protein HZB57_08175 [Gammaproteobacteria bacterium]|nr:hypothetical protein [Gammaproteobacteria bacterium]
MSGSSKQKGPLWYGYLEAGEKSSPVVRDERLDTGNGKTLFLFNLARRQILEYTREIVEPKLRELKSGEAKLDDLSSAYGEARRNFKHPNTRPLNIPERGAPAKAAKPAEDEGLGDFGGGVADTDEGAWIDSTETEES